MRGLLQPADRVPWALAVLAALTLGLAPFAPEPHLTEKLRLLFRGELRRPVDVFDLLLHGLPWLLLGVKALAAWARRG